MNEIEIPAIFDCHVHLRQNLMTQQVARWSGRVCDGVIAMPNTKPPIHDPDDIRSMRHYYTAQASAVAPCNVHMTAKWLHRTTPENVIAAKNAGAIGFKLYPQGATTNAKDGIPFEWIANPTRQVLDVLAEMERQDMVLLCHGEAPDYVLSREESFLPTFERISNQFQRLRMTLEHISTWAGIHAIRKLHSRGRHVLGTITLHHMMTTLDDVIGGKLRPDLFCMPIPKSPVDRREIFEAALSGEECFAFGSDSAPHEVSAKYCAHGCAGVFTAPVIAESLVEIFHDAGSVNRLEAFTSGNAMKFYRLEHSGRKIVLDRKDTFAPTRVGTVVVFRGGETLKWKVRCHG